MADQDSAITQEESPEAASHCTRRSTQEGVLLKTPRERFLESKFAKAHADLAVSDGFMTACEYAVLQFIAEQPSANEPTKHWDSHAQLVGARKILDILKTLADPVEPAKKTAQDTLNYNLKK